MSKKKMNSKKDGCLSLKCKRREKIVRNIIENNEKYDKIFAQVDSDDNKEDTNNGINDSTPTKVDLMNVESDDKEDDEDNEFIVEELDPMEESTNDEEQSKKTTDKSVEVTMTMSIKRLCLVQNV